MAFGVDICKILRTRASMQFIQEFGLSVLDKNCRHLIGLFGFSTVEPGSINCSWDSGLFSRSGMRYMSIVEPSLLVFFSAQNPFARCSMFSGQHPQHGPGACKPLQWTEPQRSEKNEGLLSGSSASFKHSESICVQSRS